MSSVNLSILDLVLKLPLIFNKIIFTSISGIIPAISPEKKNLDFYFIEGFRIFSILCIGLAIIIFFHADFIYQIWLGDSYKIEIFEIVRKFSFWILFLPVLFPGSFLISKNQNLFYTTVFRALQAIIKILFLSIAFYYFDISYTPYAYFISIIPGLILFIPIKKFNIRISVTFRIFLKSLIILSPMTLITYFLNFPYLELSLHSFI